MTVDITRLMLLALFEEARIEYLAELALLRSKYSKKFEAFTEYAISGGQKV